MLNLVFRFTVIAVPADVDVAVSIYVHTFIHEPNVNKSGISISHVSLSHGVITVDIND